MARWWLGMGLAVVALPAAAADNGTITGQLSYPSDGIPDDLTVCAENLSSGLTSCTVKHLNAKGGRKAYQLRVPAGDYNVYAKLTDPESYGAAYGADYRAYFSEFVTCGLMASCTSHEPIVVRVRAGKTTAKVDPADWYAQ